jgi:isoprenylcysteine carboxyl methyltransferase (ICMT) family protein YpbQ
MALLTTKYIISLQMASAEKDIGEQNVTFVTFCHCQYSLSLELVEWLSSEVFQWLSSLG